MTLTPDRLAFLRQCLKTIEDDRHEDEMDGTIDQAHTAATEAFPDLLDAAGKLARLTAQGPGAEMVAPLIQECRDRDAASQQMACAHMATKRKLGNITKSARRVVDAYGKDSQGLDAAIDNLIRTLAEAEEP